MGIVSKFVASKFSGYLLIAFLVAAAGAGYWFWTELKEFGGLEERAVTLEQNLAENQEELEKLKEQLQKKQQVNTQLAEQMAVIKRSFGAARQRIADAEANADKALRECMDMHIADGMCIGQECEDSDGDS